MFPAALLAVSGERLIKLLGVCITDYSGTVTKIERNPVYTPACPGHSLCYQIGVSVHTEVRTCIEKALHIKQWLALQEEDRGL